MTRRRMALPHPGEDARRIARVLFKVPNPTKDQCLAAVDYRSYVHAAGNLPADLADKYVIRYDGRRGCDMGSRSVKCMCGIARCTRPGRRTR